jgi:hypothetical protein
MPGSTAATNASPVLALLPWCPALNTVDCVFEDRLAQVEAGLLPEIVEERLNGRYKLALFCPNQQTYHTHHRVLE